MYEYRKIEERRLVKHVELKCRENSRDKKDKEDKRKYHDS